MSENCAKKIAEAIKNGAYKDDKIAQTLAAPYIKEEVIVETKSKGKK